MNKQIAFLYAIIFLYARQKTQAMQGIGEALNVAERKNNK